MVIKFENPRSKAKLTRAKVKRSRMGCLSCRKRKKKCDECKPSCSSCLSRGVECVWPEGKERLPKAYQIPSPVTALHKRKKITTSNADPVGKEVKLELSPPCSNLSDFPHLSPAVEPLSPEEYESLDNETCMVVSTRTNSSNMIEPMDVDLLRILPLQMLRPTENQLFMDACVNGFITSVGPQYTHPLLTTNATFTPLLRRNRVIEKVGEACGCAFLSWSSPNLIDLSVKKYQAAILGIMEYVDSRPIAEHDEIWLGAAFQLLCLGAKVTSHCDNKVGATNLKNSYKLIKAKVSRRQKSLEVERLEGPKLPNDGFFEDVSSNSLKLEIKNTLIGYENSRRNALFGKQFERMFIESFLYNYSVSILTTHDIENYPNPFEVFKILKAYLKTPLFSCDVVWMNNPVLGAASDAFEVAAKASYLIRTARSQWSMDCAKKLLDIAKFYPTPIIPPEIRVNERKYANLKESVKVAEIVIRASSIVLRKVVDPTLSEYDPDVQRDIDYIMPRLFQIPLSSRISLILTWSLFIVGLSLINDNQRKFVVNMLLNVEEMSHARALDSVIDVLNVSWGLTSSHGLQSDTRGLDVLLDRSLLCAVFI